MEVDLPGDINPANDKLTFVFTNDTTVVGGTMLGSTAVCKGLNSGNLELTGYTGYIDYWEYSTAGGPPWTALPDSADIYSYNSDGDNDVWNIIGIEQYPDNAVTIMNNHGQIVFEQETYNNTWKGDSLPDGSYYYMVRIRCFGQAFQGRADHQ